MGKTLLGIDMGYDSLKLALVANGKVKKTASVPMPLKLIKEGKAVSPQTMGELIRSTVKQYGLGCRNAAVCFANESVFVRNITVPQMTHDQLMYNIPFEFKDYLTDEPKNYVYDYAVVSTNVMSEGDQPQKAMDLLAVAAPVSLIEETRETVRKAGMKLAVASPTVSAYVNLIRRMPPNNRPDSGEYCILDLGYGAVRMYMFKGDVHQVTRVLELGLSGLDDTVAEAYGVDVRLAHTYFLSNYDNCQERQECLGAYNNIAVELSRALNFYRFSNQDSNLGDIWLCGGGAQCAPLKRTLTEALGMNVHDAEELIYPEDKVENCGSLIQAIGVAMDGTGA